MARGPAGLDAPVRHPRDRSTDGDNGLLVEPRDAAVARATRSPISWPTPSAPSRWGVPDDAAPKQLFDLRRNAGQMPRVSSAATHRGRGPPYEPTTTPHRLRLRRPRRSGRRPQRRVRCTSPSWCAHCAAAGADVACVAARVARRGSTKRASPRRVIDVGGARSRAADARRRLCADADDDVRAAAAAEACGLLFNQDLSRALERCTGTGGSTRSTNATRCGASPRRVRQRHRRPLPPRGQRAAARGTETLPRADNEHSRALWSPTSVRTADRVLVPSAALRPYVIEHGARPGAVARDSQRRRPRPVPPLTRDACADRPVKNPSSSSASSAASSPGMGSTISCRAFRRLHRSWNRYRLLIVGDGPLRAEAGGTAARSGSRRTLPRSPAPSRTAEVPRLDRQHGRGGRALPASSHGFYFSPIKIFEYMAAGAPVVASRSDRSPSSAPPTQRAAARAGRGSRRWSRASRS